MKMSGLGWFGKTCYCCFWLIFLFHEFTLPAQSRDLSPEEMLELDRIAWVSLSWDDNPPAPQPLHDLRSAIEGRTSLVLYPFQTWQKFSAVTLHSLPLLHIEMCGGPPKTAQQELFLWRDFFNQGSSLVLDQCASKPYQKEWEDWIQQILPEGKWRELHQDALLSMSFYLLEKRQYLLGNVAQVYTFEDQGRVHLFQIRHAPWAFRELRQQNLTITANSISAELLLRLYTNIFMIVQAGNYKADQMHLPTILQRRK